MAESLPRSEPAMSGVQLKVNRNAFRLGPGVDQDLTYDVEINGEPVWSVQPRRDSTGREDGLWFDWPVELKPYLLGRSTILIRAHISGETVAEKEHTFGDEPDAVVSVRNSDGRPLAVDKWGHLVSRLEDEAPANQERLLDEMVRLLGDVKNACGLPTFVCFGTLLGAVRDHDLIGHDNDVDIAYLSAYNHPVDITRESFRVERRLRESGWVIRRGSSVRINVRLTMPDDTLRYIDIFSFGWVEGLLYMPSDLAVPATAETMLPLSTVELAGRQVPAPANSEQLLEMTYGPNWRVPDPSFRYEIRRPLKRRYMAWYGGLHARRRMWDAFAVKTPRRLLTGPTPFAKWAANVIPEDHVIVDLGCGTGRDTLWFARQGRTAIGLDYLYYWIGAAEREAARRQISAEFRVCDLSDSRAVLALGAELARMESPVTLYARFLLSAVDEQIRQDIWRVAQMALRSRGQLLLEFRTTEDASRSHVFERNERQRFFLDPEQAVSEIEATGGRIVQQITGDNLARFKSENPHVCRLVATWS
ncbi:MAG: hypothetical protein AVDCRST_MAG21-1211 [uncultured Nocardioidaceae bacterium]|uniref:Methyltransferase domain-containing protein n=1 Tax=uncultured Nocardioidaceae bacterium TaxID=253824 RepID=A0A6J4MZB5_9ACTN|nr:MAG: hypothetical protein AVDCRST_MAG21-1211 [uncultured Nocardioidaceae bacterium]